MAVRKTTTFIYPSSIDAVAVALEKNAQKLKGLLFSVFATSRGERMAGSNKLSASIKMPKINKKNILRVIVPIVIFVVIILVIFAVFGGKHDSNVAGVSSTSSNVDSDVKTTQINKTFQFPLKDDKGVAQGKFTYEITSAELRHHIVVKGQNATSVSGRVFLIVNLKIVNTLSQGLKINSRDYIRVSVNGNDKEWFAPDIHNDPVDAQAISTTDTRVGMAINESDKNIRLQIGEISGKKQIIPVSFN